ELTGVGEWGVEAQADPELVGPSLQDLEQATAADAAESVTGGPDRAPPEMHLDVVPVIERIEDLIGRLRIGPSQRGQRLVREHDAPAVGVGGAIALEHRELVRAIPLLHQQGEVQAGRAAADAD